MSIRGEIIEAQKRVGERRAREVVEFYEDYFGLGAEPAPPTSLVERPPTLYQAGPWMARMGVRCGPRQTDANVPG